MAKILLILTALALLGFLVLERARLARRRRAIPLLIAVTGTRGKTTVTRLLASVLRSAGWHVLAKSTGSEAVLILPDAEEQPVPRTGPPSIIEQKALVRLGADLGVSALIAECMSIRPESHAVEGRRLLLPDLVLVTNFRVDHGADVGWTRESAAAAIARSIPRTATVLLPEREAVPGFCTAVEDSGAELMLVKSGAAAAAAGGWAAQGFLDNLDLVIEAARRLGLDDESILSGIGKAHQDIGALGLWRYPVLHDGNPAIVVNAFAANDPYSTAMVYDKVMDALAQQTDCRWTGLLSLRGDRADRTAQWVRALNQGMIGRFSRLRICGEHARAAAWRLQRSAGAVCVKAVRSREPDGIMREVLLDSPARGQTDIVFGFGNIGGAGRGLVSHWRSVGKACGTESTWA